MTDEPEFLIGQMRLQTVREETFFYVSCQPTAMSALDQELDKLVPILEVAQAQAHVGDGAPVIIRYYKTGEPGLFTMEVGVPVRSGTLPAGEAQVMTLPPVRCASLIYWGSLAHIGQAYETLMRAIKAAGLEHSGESREWYYHFEGDTSPNNVIGLQMQIG
jgi:effector-binding domain-containing protein